MYNSKAFNLVYNVQYTRREASSVLFALASKQWTHGKTNSSLGTLHRDSLTWRRVCSSGNRWRCTDLSITSRFPQNDSNCNMTWRRLACSEDRSSTKQLPPTWNTVLSFTDYYRVCDHHKWFYTQSFTDCKLERSNFSEQPFYPYVTLVA